MFSDNRRCRFLHALRKQNRKRVIHGQTCPCFQNVKQLHKNAPFQAQIKKQDLLHIKKQNP
jgi:hypothetical protein